MVRPDTWQASQALVVRNEATVDNDSHGGFSQSGEMKTVQETIQELVNSRAVLGSALADVGRPSDSDTATEGWPSPMDISELRQNVSLNPPRGAEFGSTEVFYLTVEDRSRTRAVQLVEAVCSNLERRYQELRDQKAQSMIGELVRAGNLARNDLAESTARLTRIEQQVGADLAELRILHDSSSGSSALRQTATEIRTELRQAQTDEETSRQLLTLLKQAQGNSDRLVATPSRLLQAQPALSRLVDGLVDAKLATAALEGKMAEGHPHVLAAEAAENAIEEHLHDELAAAIRGIEVDLHLTNERTEMLKRQLEEVTGRLTVLASLRADYSTQVAETRNRTGLLERAEQKLAEVRISQASAAATSLISPLDSAEAGIDPIGPGRAVIVLAGIVGGLITGLGILLLTVQPANSAAPINSGSLPAGLPGNPAAAAGSASQKPTSPSDSLSLTEALDKLVRDRVLWD